MQQIFRKLRERSAYKLLRNTLLYGIGDLLQKFLAILLIPIYTKFLEPSDYGVLALLSILIMVISTLATCGLTNGISRYFYYLEHENTTKAEVIWSPMAFVFILSTILVAGLVFFSERLSILLFDNPAFAHLVNLTLFNVLILNISSISRTILIVEEKVWQINCVNIIGVIVGVISGVVCVVHLKRGVQGVVEAGVIASIIMAGMLWYFAMPKHEFAFNSSILKRQLKYSLPLTAAVFAFFLIDSSDRFLLKQFLPLSEVGLYNIGYQGGMIMMLLVGGFTTAWPPYYHKNNQNGEGQLICSKVLNLYLPVAGIFAVMISLSAPLALRLMTPQSYFEAYTVVPFVAMAYMLKGPYLIFMMGVLMKEKTTWQLSLEAVAAGLNIGLNILLIPLIGREAAAITTLFSYGLMVFGAYLMVGRINPIPGLSLIKIAGVVLICFLLASSVFIPGYSKANWWIVTLAVLFCGVALAWWCKCQIANLNSEAEAQ